MKIADFQLDGWDTHWPPETWPVSRCPTLFSVYSSLSLFVTFFFFFGACVCPYLCIFLSLSASVMPAGKASRVRLSRKRCDQ